MKVIKNGREATYKTTCQQCRSVLEYTEEDVYYITEKKRGGLQRTVGHIFKPDEYYVNVYTQTLRCVKCPVCGNVIRSIDLGKNSLSYEWERIF